MKDLWIITHGKPGGSLVRLFTQEQADIAKALALYPGLEIHLKEGPSMQTVRHYRPGEVLHIETPLGIVNIRVGLVDRNGRSVDSIAVYPDAIEGKRKVVLYGRHNTRLVQLKGGKR